MGNKILSMTEVDLCHKRVVIREDFNVPMENGKITNHARLIAAIPTLEYAFSKGAKIILLSHLGRPEEGQFDSNLSLEPIAAKLSELMHKPVKFEKDWLNHSENIDKAFQSSDIVLCENVRFNKGEKKNDETLSRKMASLGDIFVMDAFATAHRAEASTVGVAKYAPIACAGLLLIKELEALEEALENPKKPVVAIVGGSKVSTKLTILEKLIEKVDGLILGGGIANTFLKAKKVDIGKSLYEPELVNNALQICSIAEKNNIEIYLPKDVVTAKEFSEFSPPMIKNVNAVSSDEMILDIGPKTAKNYDEILKNAGTIIWNGPVGVFEFEAFSHGTQALAASIANSSAFSLAGGGDTISAIEKFKIENKVSYISTGGGAFLEFMEGKKLPAIDILEQRAK
jgi:phosphoglycerate kinase